MLNKVLQNSLNASVSVVSGFSVCIWGGEGLDVTLPSNGSGGIGGSGSSSGGGSGSGSGGIGGYLESTRLCD